MTPDVQRLSAHLVSNLSASQASVIPTELVVDVVRGVVDEHRQDLRPEAYAALVAEARQRLERLERARSSNTVSWPSGR